MNLERRIEFSPAWDKRHKDPDKDYGIHCVDISFLLIGENGALDYRIFTNWYLEKNGLSGRGPVSAGLHIHSKKPLYDGHECREDCELICPCYSDISSLTDFVDDLVRGGSEEVWKRIEEAYKNFLPD